MISRHAKKIIRNNSVKLKACSYSFVLTQLVVSPYSLAGPAGGNIVDGAGSINQSALTTTINQGTSRLAIDWQSFNVNQNETVNFIQPDSSSIVLNRILDQNTSEIHGAINANGQVILVNPNGVFFGETATVDVGGLFVGALDIDAEAFMNDGRLDLKALEGTSGLIVNEGTLKVIDGGTLALMGQKIENKGLLVANFGTVSLAAGSDISVKFDDQIHTSITINANTLAGVLGVDDPAIFNSGIIQAHGGRVVLNARQAQAVKDSIANFDTNDAFSFDQGSVIEQDGVVYLAGPEGDISDLGVIDVSNGTGDAGDVSYAGNNINHSGLINADSQNGNGGSVVIDSTETTLLTGDSSISAQSNKQGTGGTVHVLGKQVGLVDNANINVSGVNGGGEVLIGGDYQGKNLDIKNAEAVYLGADTSVSANATKNGNGGEIIVWSDKASRVYGSLNAKGGAQSGDGGFIETSSHGYVDLAPKVDVHAVNGKQGVWLIDPSSITISSAATKADVTGVATEGPVFSTTAAATISNLNINLLEDALGNGAEIIVKTAANADLAVGGNITLLSDLDLEDVTDLSNAPVNGTYSLTLDAHNNININKSVIETGGDDALNLTLIAGGAITIKSGEEINTAGGDFKATGTSFTATGSDIITVNVGASDTGNVEITAIAGNVNLGNITTGASNGDLTISATGSISDGASTLDISGITTLAAGNVSNITLDNAGNDFKGDVIVTDGATVTLRDKNDLKLGNISSVITLDARATGALSQAGGTSISNTSNAILFSNGAGFDLGNISVNNNLTVSASGDVAIQTGSTVNVTNVSDFTSTTGSITLLGANSLGNTLRLDSATFSTVESSGAVNLGTTDVGDDLNITAIGSVTDSVSENVIVGGLTTLTVSENSVIALDSSGNDFTDDISVIANTLSSLTVNDVSAFTLQTGLSVTNNLDLRADSITTGGVTLGAASTLKLTSTGGDINQTVGIVQAAAGNTILSANGAINFTQANRLSNIQIDNSADLYTTTTATINNDVVTNLNGINRTTNLIVTSTSGITESDVIDVSTRATFDTGINNLELNNSIHNLNEVVVTAAGLVSINEADSINVSGTMNRLNVIAGFVNIGDIGNVEDIALSVANDSVFEFRRNGNVNLANFTGGLRNNLAGDISVIDNGRTISTVDIRNGADVHLASRLRVADTLAIDTTGDISQGIGADIRSGNVLGETTTLSAANITLLEANDFRDLDITDSTFATVRDIDQVVFNSTNNGVVELTAGGPVTLNGDMTDLTVTASGDVVSGTGNQLIVSGDTVVNLVNRDINFDTNRVNLNTLTVQNALSVLIDEADGIKLSGDMQSLNLTLASSGNIENHTDGLVVLGATTLDAGNGNIVLNNSANDFVDINISNVQDLTLHDANNLTLKNITANNLNVTTNGLLTQLLTDKLVSTGTSVLDSNSGDISLLGNNEFSDLTLNGTNATVNNAQSMTVSGNVNRNLDVSVTSGDLTVNVVSAGTDAVFTAQRSIFDNNGVANNVTASFVSFSAADGIGMGGLDSEIDISASKLSALNSSAGDININNSSGSITLESIINNATDTGNFNFNSTNDVYINNITLKQQVTGEAFFDFGTGRVNMRTEEGSFFAVGDETVADITATNLWLFGLKGTLGSLDRSVLLDISGKVELFMRASLAPQYVDPAPEPADIQDNSTLRFTSADTLSAANGVQVTEVETLLDIDPAIFTELQHFVVDADPVLLPRDQLFDVDDEEEDEDDNYFKRISGESEELIN